MDDQNGIVTSIHGWLAKPFNAQGSALDWFLWLGLVLIVVYFWQRVLATIEAI